MKSFPYRKYITCTISRLGKQSLGNQTQEIDQEKDFEGQIEALGMADVALEGQKKIQSEFEGLEGQSGFDLEVQLQHCCLLL